MVQVIQTNPHLLGNRAAAFLLLEQLRNEERRIHVEIDRVTRILEGQLEESHPRSPICPNEHIDPSAELD
jgi:hypothetical protein